MKPLPSPSPVTAPYWDAAREGRLLLRRCDACGAVSHPPRPLCVACWSDALSWIAASGRGTIVSATIVHQPPSPAYAADVPYVLAIVDLDEGPRMMANVVGCDPRAVRIGARVRVTFEARGDFAIPQLELDPSA